jgi:hypothetical protein
VIGVYPNPAKDKVHVTLPRGFTVYESYLVDVSINETRWG